MIHWDYIYVLIQSSALELLTYLLIMPLFIKTPHRKKIAISTLPMNAITHPIFFFFIMGLPINFIGNILIGEFLVTVVEALMLKKIFNELTMAKALGLSLIANLVSWQWGPILTYFIKS
jgi:hypothetical protein